MTLDHVNALFESVGAIAKLYDCLALYRAKRIAGIHPASTIFFFSWGIWNIVFFGGLHQPWSLVGSTCLCLTNALWLGLAYIYRKGKACGYLED